jgi:deazaflavin-dependent oxidoreductase (nitroreductase family)
VPNIRWLLSLITTVHRFVYLASGGRLGHRMLWMRTLLLTHRGRKTGRTRVTPLLYIEDQGRWVVVASNAGDDRDPAWWRNLRAHPEAEVQLGRERLAVRARQASPAEAERLWPLLTASYRYYPEYRARASREIPVVLLEPGS